MIARITAGVNLRAAVGMEEALVRPLREGARRVGERRQQEVRGLPGAGGDLRAALGGEEAVVHRLREGEAGDGGPPNPGLRRLQSDGTKLWAADGEEHRTCEALVLRLREGMSTP